MRWLKPLRAWWTRLRQPLNLGQRGERLAARFLRRLGYTIVARGQRVRLGELDLIAVDGRTIVFVEVKTRTSHEGGRPVEAVDEEKQRRMTRAALSYLKSHDLLECSARFDVIAITWPTDAARPRIEHYRHAFDAVGNGQMFA